MNGKEASAKKRTKHLLEQHNKNWGLGNIFATPETK